MVRLGLAMAIVAASAPAYAWSAQGHMASGAIAFDQLAANDAAAIDAIRRLMAAHPERARFDASLADLAGPARDRMLFELMARWPDDVRRTQFDHPGWHQELRVVSGWHIFAPLQFGEAERAFRRNLAIVRDMRANPAERAVAACWLLHLIGDMHQPLHAGHRISMRFPGSDRAGTIAWVRHAADRPPVSLHVFWDRAADLPGPDTAAAATIAREAEAIVKPDAVASSDGTAEAQFHDWTVESETLAATVAYQGAGLTASARREDAPVVSAPYVVGARRLAERRLGEAGIRIARLLENLFPAS
ncbi:S1/P1 nuclease [Sphingomonas sp. MMS24-J13]|uniref:S1/P1 nuclease n=1 Tax=Sphingomonas sp. MMS24-J13 TaxID=3238686 RepID=UPI00384EEE3F